MIHKPCSPRVKNVTSFMVIECIDFSFSPNQLTFSYSNLFFNILTNRKYKDLYRTQSTDRKDIYPDVSSESFVTVRAKLLKNNTV